MEFERAEDQDEEEYFNDKGAIGEEGRKASIKKGVKL